MTQMPPKVDVPRAAPVPPVPVTLADTGLTADKVEALIVKTLHAGELSGLQVAESVRLPYPILEPIIERCRNERLIEVRGAAGAGTAGYKYALTDLGRDRARQHFDVNQYTGPAPVPLDAYVAAMKSLSAVRGHIDRERLHEGFAHLVISDHIFEQLGPAVNANKAVFLYGSPGNGKTVIGEGLGRAIGGDMYMPYALDIDGYIVTLYDPITHESLETENASSSIIAEAQRDRRWVRIRRPVVIVGGELTLDMLDLTFNPIAKFYEAPIQMKANCGVFVVDDFGRQRIPPRDLLNRWIVPLESRVDFLTLHTGRKFEIPFNVFIIFATNLQPESLADEAFLRRIPYKIRAQNPTVEEYGKIFELNCRKRGLTFDAVMVEYLQRAYYERRNLQMRACHPRDLVEQVVDMCRYQNREPIITREMLDAACANYFLEESASQSKEVALS
jgi:hypothetical protein